MTWGEIQIVAIQKMALNNEKLVVSDLPTMVNNKKYLTYLNVMPYIANEGIRILTNRGLPITVTDTLEATDATASDDTYYYFAMSTFDSRFSKMVEINIYENASPIYTYKDDNSVISIEKTIFDKYTVKITYIRKPTKITPTTLSTEEIDLPEEEIDLLPLYIASELYKEDKIAVATIYRNEFEVALESLRDNTNATKFFDTKGWL